MVNPLLPKRRPPARFINNKGSAGILDDHAVRKSIQTRTLIDKGDGKIIINNDSPKLILKDTDAESGSTNSNSVVQFQDKNESILAYFGFVSSIVPDFYIANSQTGGDLIIVNDTQIVKSGGTTLTIGSSSATGSDSGISLITNNSERANINIDGGAAALHFDMANKTDALTIENNASGQINANLELDMNSNKIVNVTDPTNDQDAATKIYVDEALGADVTVLKATFDITSNTSVIAAAGAGIKNKIVAISIHNNDTTGSNDEKVKITDGNGGTVLIGGNTGVIYLVGRGGFFGLPMSPAHPWFETSANTALYINPINGFRIAGAIWYIQEA